MTVYTARPYIHSYGAAVSAENGFTTGRSKIHHFLVMIMMGLICSSFGMIFWNALGHMFLGSVGILSALSFFGVILQIYSYTTVAGE